MDIVEYQRPGYAISTDPQRLKIDAIARYLSERSYWAQGRTREVIERSIANSLCFGIYAEEAGGECQAGFARVVTDYATFAWLCDVFVIEHYRGYGLGKWLVECVVSHPGLQGLKNFVLATRDAHDLYRRYGDFELLPNPERWMLKKRAF